MSPRIVQPSFSDFSESKRRFLVETFSKTQLGILIKYHARFKNYPFYNDFGVTYFDINTFIENIGIFKLAIGISDEEIVQLRKPKLESLEFRPENVSELAGLTPLDFCRLCRTEIGLGERDWFSNIQLNELINKLGLAIIILNPSGNHFNLITRISNQVTVYDPFEGNRQIPFETVKRMNIITPIIINNRFSQEVPTRRYITVIKRGRDGREVRVRVYDYGILDYLKDKGYYIQNPFSQRLQYDSWNCGPLCIYAGINSGPVRMPIIIKTTR